MKKWGTSGPHRAKGDPGSERREKERGQMPANPILGVFTVLSLGLIVYLVATSNPIAMLTINTPLRIISLLMLLTVCPRTSYEQIVVPAESTITYTVISGDSVLLGNNRTEITQCVRLMNQAAERIRRSYSNQAIQQVDTPTAIHILSTIDSVLTEAGFLFYTSKDRHFDFLTLAFRDHYYGADRYRWINSYRFPYFLSLHQPYCRLIDCDLYCYIYIGIAEMLLLPLTELELPQHNFIRWNFASGHHLNWEAIDGTYHPADSTLSCYGRLQDMDEKSRRDFMRPWSANELLSYYYTLRGSKFDYDSLYLNAVKAKKDYELALSLDSSKSQALNNYVWLFVVHPEFDSEFDFGRLMRYIDRAIDIEKDLNYYDTKASLYAMVKDFQQAVKTEQEGLKVQYDPEPARKSAQKHLGWFKNGIDVRNGNSLPK
jgi:hypothetical protein